MPLSPLLDQRSFFSRFEPRFTLMHVFCVCPLLLTDSTSLLTLPSASSLHRQLDLAHGRHAGFFHFLDAASHSRFVAYMNTSPSTVVARYDDVRFNDIMDSPLSIGRFPFGYAPSTSAPSSAYIALLSSLSSAFGSWSNSSIGLGFGTGVLLGGTAHDAEDDLSFLRRRRRAVASVARALHELGGAAKAHSRRVDADVGGTLPNKRRRVVDQRYPAFIGRVEELVEQSFASSQLPVSSESAGNVLPSHCAGALSEGPACVHLVCI